MGGEGGGHWNEARCFSKIPWCFARDVFNLTAFFYLFFSVFLIFRAYPCNQPAREASKLATLSPLVRDLVAVVQEANSLTTVTTVWTQRQSNVIQRRQTQRRENNIQSRACALLKITVEETCCVDWLWFCFLAFSRTFTNMLYPYKNKVVDKQLCDRQVDLQVDRVNISVERLTTTVSTPTG